MLIAYNLKRMLNILGVTQFKKLLNKPGHALNWLFTTFLGAIIALKTRSDRNYNSHPKTLIFNKPLPDLSLSTIYL
jgi:hypothetical protein